MAGDLDKLQGGWNVTSLETDGRKAPATAIAGSRIVIDGNRFTSVGMGATYEGTVELGRLNKTKTFDLLFSAGPPAGTRNRGIYELEGDRWTICLATSGGARPESFTTKGGIGIVLETLERGPARKVTASKPRSSTPLGTLSAAEIGRASC